MTLGIVGGLSPYSTMLYYKFIVEKYREKVGKDPRLIIYSVPIQEFSSHIRSGDLTGASKVLEKAFDILKRGGARIALIAANTPHAVLDRYPHITRGLRVLDIREPVLEEIKRQGYKSIGLLATNGALKYNVYTSMLENMGVNVIVPRREAQEALMRSIEALAHGDIGVGSKAGVAQAIMDVASQGAEAIVYACTEISLIADRIKVRLPTIDSLTLHALAAVDALISEVDT